VTKSRSRIFLILCHLPVSRIIGSGVASFFLPKIRSCIKVMRFRRTSFSHSCAIISHRSCADFLSLWHNYCESYKIYDKNVPKSFRRQAGCPTEDVKMWPASWLRQVQPTITNFFFLFTMFVCLASGRFFLSYLDPHFQNIRML
jgi:hypothetical protein